MSLALDIICPLGASFLIFVSSILFRSSSYIMQMATFQHIVLFITTLLVLLVDLSEAWANTAAANRNIYSSRRTRRAALKATTSPSSPPASALYYVSANQQQESSSINDELDTQLRLRVALEAARDAERRYGLCTPESIRAWAIVDDIYLSSSASKQVERNVKKVLEREYA